MDSVQNKIVGWAFLAIGLAVIFWGIYSSYSVFTGKTKAPEIFTVPIIAQNLQDAQNSGVAGSKVDQMDPAKLQNLSPSDLQKIQVQQQAQVQDMLQKNISNQFEKMIPSDAIIKMMNLSSWSVFVFILIYAGSKISDLGIKLLKN